MHKTATTIFLLLVIFQVKGQNWLQVPSGTFDYLSGVSYGSSSHVYIVGDGPGLLKSTNSGNSFGTLSTAFLGSNMYLNSICFTSQDTGFVAGADSTAGIIFKTVNGGNTWTQVLSGGSSSLNAITFASPQVGYAVGGNLDTGVIYKTTNAGNTWTSIYNSGINQEYIAGIRCRNNNEGMAVGMSIGAVAIEAKQYAINGGTLSGTNSSPMYFMFTDVYFHSADTGFVTALDFNGSYILKTTDGGLNWNPVYSNTMQDVNKIAFANHQKGYVVGSAGLLLKTTDGGNTWINMASGVTEDLVDIAFADSTHGIIVGDFGTILRTVICTGSPSSYTLTIPPSCAPVNVNGQIYTSSGTYTQLFTNAAGCDSTLIIQVTISSGSSSSINASSCTPYTWNGITYSVTGAYSQLFINAAGCDSLVTLNLTIPVVNIGITQSANILSAAASGAQYQWLSCPAFTIIPGATAQTYTATANGNYAVKVTMNGCSDTSVCKPVTGLSLDEQDVIQLAISPNPGDGVFTLTYPETFSNAKLSVLNIQGQCIVTRELPVAQHDILDLRDQPAGVYFLAVHHPQKGHPVLYQKLVIR